MVQLLSGIEGPVLLWIQEVLRGPLDPLVCFYTALGNGGAIWIALSLAMLLYKPTRRAGVCALTALLLGLVVTNLTIKPLVARPRPWLDVPGLAALIAEGDPNSFPSGHTCAAFAAGLSWYRELPRRWAGAISLLMALAMGLSRLYVGVHYPTDVLAGAVIGSLCAWAAGKLLIALAQNMNKRTTEKGDI